MKTWKLLKIVSSSENLASYNNDEYEQYRLHIGNKGSSKTHKFIISVSIKNGKVNFQNIKKAIENHREEVVQAMASIGVNVI